MPNIGYVMTDDMPLIFDMKFNIPHFIPRNPIRWTYSMDGVIGTSLQMIKTLTAFQAKVFKTTPSRK